MPAWHQLVPIPGHVEESETARKLQLYATSIKTSVSTRLYWRPIILSLANFFKGGRVSGMDLILKAHHNYVSLNMMFRSCWLIRIQTVNVSHKLLKILLKKKNLK